MSQGLALTLNSWHLTLDIYVTFEKKSCSACPKDQQTQIDTAFYMEISCKHHKTSWLLLFPLTRAIGTTFLMYYIRNHMVMNPYYFTFSKFSRYWPQISIKEYRCQSYWQRITFVTIQHFFRSGGPMRAEIF